MFSHFPEKFLEKNQYFKSSYLILFYKIGEQMYINVRFRYDPRNFSCDIRSSDDFVDLKNAESPEKTTTNA